MVDFHKRLLSDLPSKDENEGCLDPPESDFEQTFILPVMHSCVECLFGVSTPVLIAKQINSSHEANIADHATE